jgi:threonine dehydratase
LSSKSTSGPTPEERQTAVDDLLQQLKENDMEAWDLSNDEMSKDHARYMIGGKVQVDGERVFMFGASS